MQFKRILALAALAVLSLPLFSLPAHAGVYIGVGVPGPYYRPYRPYYPRYYYGPRVVIAAPPVVVATAPPPVVVAPAPAPVYVAPATPAYVVPAR